MNKKGFTLIELISVVAILCVLTVVLLPKVFKSFEVSYADQLENVRSEIKVAGDIYINSNNGEEVYQMLLNYETVRIYLNTLSNYGYIDEKIYNPMSDDYFDIDNEYIELYMDEYGIVNYKFSF